MTPTRKGRYRHNPKEQQDQDEPAVESSGRSKQESKSQDGAAFVYHQPARVNQTGLININMVFTIGRDSHRRLPRTSPLEKLKRRMEWAPLWQAAMWVIRFHGTLSNAVPALLELLGKFLT